MSILYNNIQQILDKNKIFTFFCFELNFLFSFAIMITNRINIWSWRSSKIDAVKQAVI
jgi:hypothetical protein